MDRLAMDAMSLAKRPGSYAGASMTSSEDLVARARRGDEEAFRLIFERYTRPVISFLFHMVDRREVAEELAQEAFARAYKNLSSLREGAKLSTWLFGIAKNVAREYLRDESGGAGSVGVNHEDALRVCDTGASPAGQLLDKELQGLMRKALASLDHDKRLVFTLKVYQQCSYEEIAEITGFSEAKVRNDLSRARAELRRRMGRYIGVSYEM
jgi:RNA polymerase sigma-70 factor (ECF subfamily)